MVVGAGVERVAVGEGIGVFVGVAVVEGVVVGAGVEGVAVGEGIGVFVGVAVPPDTLKFATV